MMQSYKVLAALLSYPSTELQNAIATGELSAILSEEGLVDAAWRKRLEPLMRWLGDEDLLTVQEHYVGLFDRSKARSLYLFEHLHGESRDRGQAMVDLTRMYEDAGLAVAPGELPDFLPLFLEYLSILPPDEARARLAQPVHIVATLARRLHSRESVYAPVLALLEALSNEPADITAVAELLEEPDDDPDDTERLDAEWAEEPVIFGPGAGIGDAPPCQRMEQIADSLSTSGGSAR